MSISSPIESVSVPVTIRRAVPDDWPSVESILARAKLPVAGARDHFDNFMIAERDRVIVGCIGMERYGSAGLVRSLAVQPEHRDAGIGRRLVEASLAHARVSGVQTMALLTETAEPYWERFGFSRVDRAMLPAGVFASAEFKGACPTTAIAMSCDLSPHVDVPTRLATRDDLPSIAAIYNEGIRGRDATFETRERSAADIESWLERPEHPTLVAVVHGNVVGWARASEYRPRAAYNGVVEFSIYVTAEFRRRGVATRLLDALVVECERRDRHKLLSRIFVENEASRSLCRRHGFREVGVYQRHARLDGEWRDVVIVERLIGEAAR
jgi:L-amino acid N-acyltransferase YncA